VPKVTPLLKISAVVLLASLMLHIGFQMNRDHLRAVLTNFGLLGRTVLANFIAVPIYGLILVRLFHLTDAIATGVLLMAISPGGRGILISGGRKKGGSLGFAVALTFILPAVSIVSIPITAYLLLGTHVATLKLIFVLVVFQLVPLLLGMLIAERAPEIATRLERPLGIIVVIVLLVVLVLLVPVLIRSIATIYGSFGIWAMLCLVLLSLITGWLLGGPQREYRRTLGLGTALRSFAFCAAVAATSFAGTEASAAVLTYFVIQMVVSGLVGIYFQRTASLPQTAA
jgi:bile acid:Na+ symporter, BASS family